MVNIKDVQVTFESRADDAKLFESYFGAAIARWWRGVEGDLSDREEGRLDRALMPPPRR